MEIVLKLRLRQLLRKPPVQRVFHNLYNQKHSQISFNVPLYATQEEARNIVLNDNFIFSNASINRPHGQGVSPGESIHSHHFPKEFAMFPDIQFIEILEKEKVVFVTSLIMVDRYKHYVSNLKVNNREALEQIYDWLKAGSEILEYGIFSLNAITGEAYCGDRFFRLQPNRGPFRVFRALLQAKGKRVTFQHLYQLYYPGEEIKEAQAGEAVYEIIKTLRRTLDIENTDLLEVTDGGYRLRRRIRVNPLIPQ